MYQVFHVAHGSNVDPVAVVDAKDLDQVYADTNNIQDAWTKNMSIVSYSIPAGRSGIRSTSVDDLIFDIDAQVWYKVSNFGFEVVTEDSEETVAMVLMKEWVGVPVGRIVQTAASKIPSLIK